MRVTWQMCPTCQGRGEVPASLYGIPYETTAYHQGARCRTCNGDTIISHLNGLPPSRQPDSESPAAPLTESD